MPWRAIGWTPLQFLPSSSHRLPAAGDLAFSCWFFYWYWKAQDVVTAYYGWATAGRTSLHRRAVFRAYLGCACWCCGWRGYLKQVWLAATGRKSEVSDADEPISYRTALLGRRGDAGDGAFAHAAASDFRWCRSSWDYFALALPSRACAPRWAPRRTTCTTAADQIIPRLWGTTGWTSPQ